MGKTYHSRYNNHGNLSTGDTFSHGFTNGRPCLAPPLDLCRYDVPQRQPWNGNGKVTVQTCPKRLRLVLFQRFFELRCPQMSSERMFCSLTWFDLIWLAWLSGSPPKNNQLSTLNSFSVDHLQLVFCENPIVWDPILLCEWCLIA